MRFLSAYAAALCTSVLSACILGWGGLTPSVAFISLVLGAIAGLLAATTTRTTPQKGAEGPRGFWEWFTVAAFSLFALRAFCWVIFFEGNSIKTLSPNNLGDLCLHLTYIRYLANGVHLWPDNPIFAAGKLNYPLGTDLLNSLLLLSGVPIERGLIWMGLIGSLATGLALWRWGRAFAMAGFLFNGGLAGFLIFSIPRLTDFQADLAWKSIPLSMFVTQRGLLYALPVGLMLLDQWRSRFFRAETQGYARPVPLPIWLEVLLYSTLPLFHVHTFLFLSFLLGIWFVVGIARKQIVQLVAASFLPATLLLSQVAGFSGHHSLIHFKAGWMQENQNFLIFWFLNFGVLPLLATGLCVVLIREFQLRKAAALFVLPAIGIFLMNCFVMWAPWAWDNTKMMIWSYLVILPFLWSEVIANPKEPYPSTKVVSPTPGRIAGQALLCGTLFLSGFLSLLGGLDATHTGFEVAKRTEVGSLGVALKDLPKEAIFAGCPTWNHPLLLNGRKLAVGYDGHLWSHGIDYADSMHRLQDLMTGKPGWRQLAKQLNVRYVFWGRLEAEKWPESLQPWNASAPCIARDNWGSIYDLQEIESASHP